MCHSPASRRKRALPEHGGETPGHNTNTDAGTTAATDFKKPHSKSPRSQALKLRAKPGFKHHRCCWHGKHGTRAGTAASTRLGRSVTKTATWSQGAPLARATRLGQLCTTRPPRARRAGHRCPACPRHRGRDASPSAQRVVWPRRAGQRPLGRDGFSSPPRAPPELRPRRSAAGEMQRPGHTHTAGPVHHYRKRSVTMATGNIKSSDSCKHRFSYADCSILHFQFTRIYEFPVIQPATENE